MILVYFNNYFLLKGEAFSQSFADFVKENSYALNIKLCILCQDDIYFHFT